MESYCTECNDYYHSNRHREVCEKDKEGLENARKWMKKMELEDKAIEHYHYLQDQGERVPDVGTFIRNFLSGHSL